MRRTKYSMAKAVLTVILVEETRIQESVDAIMETAEGCLKRILLILKFQISFNEE